MHMYMYKMHRFIYKVLQKTNLEGDRGLKHALYLTPMIVPLAESHLNDLLIRLDYNGYYAKMSAY